MVVPRVFLAELPPRSGAFFVSKATLPSRRQKRRPVVRMFKPVDPALFLFNAPPHHFRPFLVRPFWPIPALRFSPRNPNFGTDNSPVRSLDRRADWLPQELFLGANRRDPNTRAPNR